MFVAMAEGRVKGLLCIGQNPATSLNASVEREGLRRLEWLVVKDNFLTETAAFWSTAPEVEHGDIRPADIQTEVFFFPSAQVAELDGSFTNTQRMLQWHFKAADPPGDCRWTACFKNQRFCSASVAFFDLRRRAVRTRVTSRWSASVCKEASRVARGSGSSLAKRQSALRSSSETSAATKRQSSS